MEKNEEREGVLVDLQSSRNNGCTRHDVFVVVRPALGLLLAEGGMGRYEKGWKSTNEK